MSLSKLNTLWDDYLEQLDKNPLLTKVSCNAMPCHMMPRSAYRTPAAADCLIRGVVLTHSLVMLLLLCCAVCPLSLSQRRSRLL